MEIIKQLTKAINYMEENLLESITYHDAADHVYMSSFHFHRTFKILTGFTPNEYIRNRRLSKAGEEITLCDLSILDLAMKYQYDSLEGFSKAFTRFHKISPLKAKQGDVKLKTFHPLKINISFEGGKSMDYKVVSLEPFYLLAKNKKFVFDTEINLIPGFWDEQIKDGLFEKLANYSTEPGIYGACHQVDKTSNKFDYGIGVKVDKKLNVEGLDVWEVNNPLWAVFECKSAEHIGKVWEVILKEFFVNSNYERVEDLDFELYDDKNPNIFCELYVPIRKTK
ncbi:hypothetical protein CI105_08475 [Candidatus Izimaplasma bacterium ZiA1]|uniref:AraC family transcriptional regulator n=1 Tax=Candidatus Izimoplasma sp. ZiA1 TaxID=2024899 RepID=UPI000BAA5A72|nr:hypothetical protein CI105_08475 [Candidatus Izimaplasma bacterium ZiA1]